MERTLSVEEKIRRAEQIYERRKQGSDKQIATVSVNNEKKDIRLLKKMIVQILICISIYLVIYFINNSEYVFSKDFINKMTRFRQGVVYGQWRIHESDFLEIETRIPSSKEQIKMGSLFKQIDNTIAFHQQKVNDYQKLKEGILKKMFI